jgi:hypothetical protein
MSDSLACALIGVASSMTVLIIGHVLKGRDTRFAEYREFQHRLVKPLRLCAAELALKLDEAHSRVTGSDYLAARGAQAGFYRASDRGNWSERDFLLWCNGSGHYYASMLYAAAKYFSFAIRVAERLRQVDGGRRDRLLLEELDALAFALGTEHNLWILAQDSIGHRMSTSAHGVLDFHAFSEALARGEPWLLRLRDFFKDLHLKNADREVNVWLLRLRRLAPRVDPVVAPASGGSSFVAMIQSLVAPRTWLNEPSASRATRSQSCSPIEHTS